MATPAQLAANIANSAHSTGPRTDSGKDRVSENAITHGLTSSRVILPNEDPAEWQAFSAAVIARYNPGTPDEHRLATTIANAEWRLFRAWRAHDHIIGMVTLSLSEHHQLPIEPAAALADQFIAPESQRRLSLNLRYIRAHERAHETAIATFFRIQKARLAAEAQAEAEAEKQARLDPPAASTPAPAASSTGSSTPEPPPSDPTGPAEQDGTPAAHVSRAERRAIERAARKAARNPAAAAGRGAD
jgi:hypothetical protein